MRLYLGIPFYGGADANFVGSLVKLRIALHIAGHEVECCMHTGCSILPKARNEMVMKFMESGFDKLLFLDTDMVFNVSDVFKLIDSEHGICALNYRRKSEEKDEYTACLTGREKDGWQQASIAGTGCMVISRNVTEKMQQDYPETRYVTDNGEIAFSLFDLLNYEGRYWTEDSTFCRRAIDSGFDVSVLKDADVGHVGNKIYK